MLTEQQKQEIQEHLQAIQGLFHTALFTNEQLLSMTVHEMLISEAARHFAIMWKGCTWISKRVCVGLAVGWAVCTVPLRQEALRHKQESSINKRTRHYT